MSSLKPKTRGRKTGEKRTLSPEQEIEIIRTMTEQNPDQLKMKYCLWTCDAVKQLIQGKYGINMLVRTVGQYLQRWALQFSVLQNR